MALTEKGIRDTIRIFESDLMPPGQILVMNSAVLNEIYRTPFSDLGVLRASALDDQPFPTEPLTPYSPRRTAIRKARAAARRIMEAGR